MAKLTDYLTIAEAAELLNVHQRTVNRWIDGGYIKPVERFGLKLIHRKDCKRPDGLDPRGGHNAGTKKGGATCP